MATQNAIADGSGDRKYFVMIPRMVLLKMGNPDELAVWLAVKDVAGEDRECYLTTEDLAVMAGVSMGTVSKCRKSLIAKGLLEGIFRKDPGYPQPVWHLRIPDLWKENIEWCESKSTIASKLEYKRANARPKSKRGRRKSLHCMKPSYNEGGVTPYEAKNNQVLKPTTPPIVVAAPSSLLSKEESIHNKKELIREEEQVREYREYLEGLCGPDGNRLYGVVDLAKTAIANGVSQEALHSAWATCGSAHNPIAVFAKLIRDNGIPSGNGTPTKRAVFVPDGD